MSELLEKISSYNIFNNLLPGVLFAVICERFTNFDAVVDDLFLAVFVYYFYGLVISRIGSLIMEPPLTKLKIIVYSDHLDYVKAEAVDPKIQTLLETHNMYRSLCGMFLIASILVAISMDKYAYCFCDSVLPLVGCVIGFFMFLGAWRKQSDYINSRVARVKSESLGAKET
jgi:hypothetical protein